VLRKANLLQSAVRFDVVFVGPARRMGSSVGMAVADIRPLPGRLPDGALVVVPGHADVPLGIPVTMPAQDAAREVAIVDWLRRAIRPGVRVATICSGAMLVARAGLLDGFECTTHHECTDELARLPPLGARA
jgi:transcriptional regulator GlxA family with amidase domain